ncbi:Peritrophin-1 [Papilio xuthus]|uniref:Peritrophin-1 n=1 Tax=Papilio xuthus TaxID=66420 RepID=A0A194PQ33_PAPXU|nr:Peritrophin-1 [Papilio xuthus]
MFILVCIAALAVAVSGDSGYCGNKNEYVKMAGSCDSFYECIESNEFERTCPDGLYFNPKAQWPEYPCGYPGDVECSDGVPQPPRSSADCPHEYGFFESPLATSSDCGKYRRCVAGVAFEEECPPGLAFNPAKGTCDWPSEVASCNAEAFVGYSCPPGSVDQYGYDITENFGLPGKCYSFIACHRGNARLVSCDLGYKFDTSVNRCVNSDLVRTDFQCEKRHS